MADPRNIGRAYAKVVLYRSIPNLVQSTAKLRKSHTFPVTFGGETAFKRTSYGVQYLAIATPDGTGSLSAGIIPMPLHEPQHNYLTKVYGEITDDEGWSWMGWSNGAIPTGFDNRKNATIWEPINISSISGLFLQQIGDKDELAAIKGPGSQEWVQKEEKVDITHYNEREYFATNIGYPANSSSSSSESTAGAAKNKKPPKRMAARQVQASPKGDENGVLWGITTKNRFKAKGQPFWVDIISGETFKTKEGDDIASAALGIKFSCNSKDSTQHYVLVINEKEVKLVYEGKTTEPATTGTGAGSGTGTGAGGGGTGGSSGPASGGTSGTSTTVKALREIPINLPSLPDKFRGKADNNNIRIGFIMLLGRICFYVNSSEYHVVDIKDKDNKHLLNSFEWIFPEGPKDLEVYGYSCKASVIASPMTFYQRAWFVLPDMLGEERYRGFFDPEVSGPVGDGTTSINVAAGGLCNGYLISFPQKVEQYVERGRQPLYGGQFKEYKEVDTLTTAAGGGPTIISLTQPDHTTPPKKGLNDPNRWGEIHVVRSKSKKGIYDDPAGGKGFWFCYLETKKLERDVIDYEHPATVLGTHSYFSGFPAVFNIMGRKVLDTSVTPVIQAPPSNTVTPTDGSSEDISEFVVDISVSNSLDNVKPSLIEKDATVNLYDPDGRFMRYMMQARGIRIWLKWDTASTTVFRDRDIVFNGIAYGEASTQEPGRQIVRLKCKDYWHILDKMKIKNSPFYDGFELFSVVKDLGERAGVESNNNVDHNNVPYYALASGFAFDKPAYRFDKETTIKECVKKTIQHFPVYCWFDNFGKIQMDVVPGSFDWSFITTPGWNGSLKKYYYLKPSSCTASHPEKLVLNKIQMSSNLFEGVYNSFIVRSVNRATNRLVIHTRSSPALLTDPDAKGYLGYVAEKSLSKPGLWDENAARKYTDLLKKMYSRPGFETSIDTIGHNTLYSSGGVYYSYRPGEYIAIMGDHGAAANRFRVTAITHKFSAEQNEWSTNVAAYQITPGRISFSPT